MWATIKLSLDMDVRVGELRCIKVLQERHVDKLTYCVYSLGINAIESPDVTFLCSYNGLQLARYLRVKNAR